MPGTIRYIKEEENSKILNRSDNISKNREQFEHPGKVSNSVLLDAKVLKGR
jgi:hypothetical protein